MKSTSVAKRLGVIVAVAALLAVPAFAAMVQQMSLDEMAGHAGQIFRGTVLDVRQGTVRAGGGDIPTVTYILRVDEPFKGNFDFVKGERIAKIQMVGKMKSVKSGSLRSFSALPELPRLEIGGDYLLLTTRPSTIGLSTTVGLGQGAFRLSGKPGLETAINGNHNLGLFPPTGSNKSAAVSANGAPIPYSILASALRDSVGH